MLRFVILFLGLAFPALADIILAGSTTVSARILNPLQDDIKRVTGIAIRIDGVGSTAGIKRLLAGECDAAIISSQLKGIVEAEGINEPKLQQHDLLEDLVVTAVNSKNQIKALSGEQIQALYSGKIKNWKELGGPDVKVAVIIPHAESATRELIYEFIMDKKVEFAKSARIAYGTKKEIVQIAENEGGIGSISKGYLGVYIEEMKNEKLSPELREVEGKIISRPLAIVTKGDPSPEMLKLLAFLRTDQVKKKFK